MSLKALVAYPILNGQGCGITKNIIAEPISAMFLVGCGQKPSGPEFGRVEGVESANQLTTWDTWDS